MKKILILILFINLAAYSQPKLANITVYSGITSDNIMNFPLFPSINYKGGIDLGVSANLRLIGILNFTPTLEYVNFKFKNFSPGAILDSFGSTSNGISADNLSNIRLGMDFKLIKYDNAPVRFFFYTGASYLIENYGNITFPQGEGNNIVTGNMGKHYCFVHDVGLGLIFKIYENYGLAINGQYYSNYNGLLRFSANAGIMYNFPHGM